ncbi:RES family NAD+ phosphorylase [Hymenobacter rubripertinctus]|uniref:RES domain-containing protein n=1 Tax=Hymenobacter rubripertinctus TaxID=2029981 RepID=A0A418R8P5_9BACT|nr:RES family NAD+ phosphorylase [Hymenobacter rubripertinctus]RIY13786.1 RES domain-containing protein [Hymenobacter rubripertinctus]
MKLYRLGKAPYIADTSGQGGLYYGGRWHRIGSQILYTAEHLSLAKLEVLANSPVLPRRYFALTLEIPDDTPYLQYHPADLPDNWQQVPYPAELAELGRAWLTAGTHWILRVPSAHAPDEWNYLLNPLHADHARRLRVLSVEPHPFDARLK